VVAAFRNAGGRLNVRTVGPWYGFRELCGFRKR
jgi:hypothetical protein